MRYKRHANMTAKIKKKKKRKNLKCQWQQRENNRVWCFIIHLILYTYLKLLKRFGKSRPSFVSEFPKGGILCHNGLTQWEQDEF